MDESQQNLLGLPLELRHMIYKLVLKAPKPAKGRREAGLSAFEPAITQVCQHIRTEAMPLYLGTENLIICIELNVKWMEQFALELGRLVATYGCRPFQDLRLKLSPNFQTHNCDAVLPLLKAIHETKLDLFRSDEQRRFPGFNQSVAFLQGDIIRHYPRDKMPSAPRAVQLFVDPNRDCKCEVMMLENLIRIGSAAKGDEWDLDHKPEVFNGVWTSEMLEEVLKKHLYDTEETLLQCEDDEQAKYAEKWGLEWSS